jgi:hypothetical protein
MTAETGRPASGFAAETGDAVASGLGSTAAATRLVPPASSNVNHRFFNADLLRS